MRTEMPALEGRGAVGNKQFSGPLFLVGMPRSGTKLLRAMLDRHPHIRLATIETEFFPYWTAHWDSLGARDGRVGFEKFYLSCLRLPFFIQYAERGVKISVDEWYEACDDFTPAAVFEALLRHVLKIPVTDPKTIWGDKSPSYLRHLPLLKRHFPEARIIHIIRDARDCSLSAKKAWGKSMRRVAQRWHDDVSACRAAGREMGSSYYELRYENLLSEPKSVLRDVCTVVGMEFDEEMLSPGNTENLGDAKGVDTVLSSNVDKYKSRMPAEEVRMVEEITCDTLRSLGYQCRYVGKPHRVPQWRMRWLQLRDAIALLTRTMAKRGWVQGARFVFQDFKVSGNRDSFRDT